ncbi:MAG TPA: hypothetical protein VF015_08115 [Acidimicrobiales bacterium]
MDFTTIRYVVRDEGVAVVTLNRPERCDVPAGGQGAFAPARRITLRVR